jgi:hypothetical protein
MVPNVAACCAPAVAWATCEDGAEAQPEVHTAVTLTVNVDGKPDKVALPLLVAFGNGAFREPLPLRETLDIPQAGPFAVRVMTAANVPVTWILPPPGQVPEVGAVT